MAFDQIAPGGNGPSHKIDKCLHPGCVAQVRMGQEPDMLAELGSTGRKSAQARLLVANKAGQDTNTYPNLNGFELKDRIVEAVADWHGGKIAFFYPLGVGHLIIPAEPGQTGQTSRIIRLNYAVAYIVGTPLRSVLFVISFVGENLILLQLF